MLGHLADDILETVQEMPDGVPERLLIRQFSERGFGAKMLFGLVAELENAGLVRWRGNLLYRALLN
jgi:hypothetical protein